MTVAAANKIIIKSIPGHMETCWSQLHKQYLLRSFGKSKLRVGGEFNLCAISSSLFCSHFRVESLKWLHSLEIHWKSIGVEALPTHELQFPRDSFSPRQSLISLPLFDRCNQTRIVFEVNGGITSSWTCSIGIRFFFIWRLINFVVGWKRNQLKFCENVREADLVLCFGKFDFPSKVCLHKSSRRELICFCLLPANSFGDAARMESN